MNDCNCTTNIKYANRYQSQTPCVRTLAIVRSLRDSNKFLFSAVLNPLSLSNAQYVTMATPLRQTTKIPLADFLYTQQGSSWSSHSAIVQLPSQPFLSHLALISSRCP